MSIVQFIKDPRSVKLIMTRYFYLTLYHCIKSKRMRNHRYVCLFTYLKEFMQTYKFEHIEREI